MNEIIIYQNFFETKFCSCWILIALLIQFHISQNRKNLFYLTGFYFGYFKNRHLESKKEINRIKK
jgi:hypothetical protein